MISPRRLDEVKIVTRSWIIAGGSTKLRKVRITGFQDGLFIVSASHPANTHALNIDQQIYTTYIMSHTSYLMYYFVAGTPYGLIRQHT